MLNALNSPPQKTSRRWFNYWINLSIINLGEIENTKEKLEREDHSQYVYGMQLEEMISFSILTTLVL